MQLLLFYQLSYQSTFLPNFVNYLFYNTTPCQPPQSPVSCPCQWALWNITVSLFILLSISTGEKVCWTRKTWLIQSVYLERQIVWKCWWSVMVIVNKSTGLEVSWSFLQGCHDSCNDKLHSCHSCHVSSCHILHASRSTLSCTNWSYWWALPFPSTDWENRLRGPCPGWMGGEECPVIREDWLQPGLWFIPASVILVILAIWTKLCRD